MIADYLFLWWFLAITVPLYWAIPARRPGARLAFLAAVSTALLWALSPIILAGVLLFAAILAGLVAAHRRGAPMARLRTASWFVFAPLVLLEFVPPDWLVAGLLGEAAARTPLTVGFTYLGVSYTAIRCFIMAREAFEAKGPDAAQAAAAFLFFGHFVAGPISGAGPWRAAAPAPRARDLTVGASRILWGGALFFVVREYLAGLDPAALAGVAPDGAAARWIAVYRDFVVLFVDFAGYSEVAIGCALLYGVTLPENFNWPLRAASIQEFWQRWHLSLGRFINTYLFRAVVREVGRPGLAIFLSFVAVGLWHNVSLPYLVWGLGHGAALAANMALRRRLPPKDRPAALRAPVAVLGWAFTMTYVALLSAFANEPDIWAALRLLEGLV